MVVARIITGIASHFPIRVSEWVLSYMLAGIGLGLCLIPNALDASASYQALIYFAQFSPWTPEYTWGLACLSVATVRIIALTINGTFKEHFRYSPHLRGLASLAACFIWGQMVLGYLIAFTSLGGGWTAVPVYMGIMSLDAWNMFRAWTDITKR